MRPQDLCGVCVKLHWVHFRTLQSFSQKLRPIPLGTKRKARKVELCTSVQHDTDTNDNMYACVTLHYTNVNDDMHACVTPHDAHSTEHIH